MIEVVFIDLVCGYFPHFRGFWVSLAVRLFSAWFLLVKLVVSKIVTDLVLSANCSFERIIPVAGGIFPRQCCGSGSGIRCLFDPWIQDPVPFWPLDPGSGKVFSGSRIPNPYVWELSDNFLGKQLYNSLKIYRNFFLQHFKTKIIFNFVKFVAT